MLGPLLGRLKYGKNARLCGGAHFEITKIKSYRYRTTFGLYDIEKVDDVAARSTFKIKIFKITACSGHF